MNKYYGNGGILREKNIIIPYGLNWNLCCKRSLDFSNDGLYILLAEMAARV